MSWFQQLQQAQFRNIPFGVFGGRGEFGRRQALHEYPFRDDPWPEDIGRKTRSFQIVGFLLEGDLVSGNNVIAHRDAFISAAEKADTGTLVHPTMGAMQVSLLNCIVTESVDHGRMFRIELTFIEAGKKEFAASVTPVLGGVAAAATSCYAGVVAAFGVVSSLYRQGRAVIEQVQATAAGWIRQAQNLVDDATNIYNFVTTLPQTIDGMLGRFFGGRTLGGFGTPVLGRRSNLNLQGTLALGTVYREDARAALTTLGSASGGTDTDATGQAAQGVSEAVLQSCVNPADGIRLLEQLAIFPPPTYSTTAPIGVAVNQASSAAADLFRRCAVIALAEAAENYQPASYDDAVSIRDSVCAAIDAEIDVAGDQGEDGVFSLLRSLRAAVAFNLTARGAALAPIAVFNSKRPIPAPVWALRIYRDSSRSDELVTQVNPIHPAFMPTTFKALAQ